MDDRLVKDLLPHCGRQFYHGTHDGCGGWPLPDNQLANIPDFVLGAELERRSKVKPGAVARPGWEWRLVSHGPGDSDWELVEAK